MAKQIATTTLLKRISKYLALHIDDMDITYDELHLACGRVDRGKFADGMKYLLNEGTIKVVKKDGTNYYFYNNLTSPEYRKLNKVLSNEKEMARKEKWKEGDTNEE